MSTPTPNQWRAKRCVPCEGGVPKLARDVVEESLAALPGWRLAENGDRIQKRWKTRHFMAAIRFFNRVAELAESEGHHPDLHLEGYRNVAIEIWTHAIGGLSENDLILAAKIDSLEVEGSPVSS